MTDEQIIELFGRVPYFVDEKIQLIHHDFSTEHSPFISRLYWADQASINLADLCGTANIDDAGITWRDFLSIDEKMKSTIAEFRRNPSYYTDFVERFPHMYFYRSDGKTYVAASGGKHRACVGKFFLSAQENPYIHGVNLTEISVNWRFIFLFRRLLAVKPDNWMVDVKSVLLGRDDGPGWHHDHFVNMLKCSAHSGGTVGDWLWGLNDLEHEVPALEWEAMKRKQPVKTGFWQRIFGVKR